VVTIPPARPRGWATGETISSYPLTWHHHDHTTLHHAVAGKGVVPCSGMENPSRLAEQGQPEGTHPPRQKKKNE